MTTTCPHDDKKAKVMDVQQWEEGLHSGKDRTKICETHRNHISQSESTAATQGTTQEPRKRPCCSGLGHGGSDESLVDGVITSEDALLLPDHVPVLPHKLEKETPTPVSGPPPPDTIANGSLPVCTPPTASRKPECDGHSKPHKKRPSSTLKSQQSLKSSSTQIQQAAGNDCCVHCVLACLFCELASLCSALTQCLACGAECDAVCCCGEACGGLICCSEDPCSAILDCAILEDCCQSSDCMEICLECCSICFPT